MNYIVQILRTLFFNIDRVVYEGVGNVYDLLLRISRTTILSSETIDEIYGRIYALIGVFMLFKISLSLIMYILNPDEFIDKDKGFASIVKRVIISLVMLVLIPYGFKEAYALQAMLLEDNTLAALIFGEVNNNSTIDTAGEKMKFILMYTFFQPNYNGLYNEDGDANLASCAITYEYNEDGTAVERPKGSGVFKLNKDCFGDVSNDTDPYPTSSTYGTYWKKTSAKDASDLYQTYAQGVARQNFYLMFKHDIAMLEKEDSDGLYLVDYMFPLSTAVGVAVLWVLLMFCIDVAVRSVKLAFYQLIAPIPILSYIDPKSKDGMFGKWLKQCGTTYISLFLRLLALYLAVFLISKVTSLGIQDVVTGERITDWWVCIFVIIGVLTFAKQLPKMLEDTFGIKGTGDFSLNPLKRMDDMLGGKAMKRVGGTAAAMGVAGGLALGSNAITGFTTNKGFGRLKGISSGLAGGLSAMGRAALGGMKGEKFGKNWASSYGAAMQAKQSRADRLDDGVKWHEMMLSKAQQKVGVHTAGEKAKAVSDGLKAIQSDYAEYEKVVTGVDAYAKFASKMAAAASSRGDYKETRFWEEAKDQRIKEIAANGGQLIKSAKVQETDFYVKDARTGEKILRQGADTTFSDGTKADVGTIAKGIGGGMRDASAAETQDKALEGLAQHMSALAGAMNEAGAAIKGFTKITGATHPESMDVKSVKNQALGSQQGVDYNNQHLQDVDKYGSRAGQK